MNKDSGCKGCTERHLACHDTCQKYQNWKAENQKIKDKIIKQKTLNYHFKDMVRDTVKKTSNYKKK